MAPDGTADGCLGITASGGSCGAAVQAGSRYCYFHDPEREADRREARQAGGRQRSRPAAVLDGETPAPPLRSVADVTRLLGESIHQVRTGQIEPKVANCVGYLSGILLKAIEVGQIEERLAAMEAVVGHGGHASGSSDFDRPLLGENTL